MIIALIMIAVLATGSPLRAEWRLPDGIAYRDMPLSMEEMAFLEATWGSRDFDDSISYRRVRPGVMQMSGRSGEVSASGQVYLTKHGDHIYMSNRTADWRIRPYDVSFSIIFRKNQCSWVNEIQRLPNGDINYNAIDDDKTLAANPWLDKRNIAKRKNCTLAFLFGMNRADQERFILLVTPMSAQIDRKPERRLGPPRR